MATGENIEGGRETVETIAGPETRPRRRWTRLALLSFVTGFSGAMMPGPLLVATIEQTSMQGMKAVVGLITGHAILELVLVGFLILGLKAVLERRRVRGLIGLVGGAALIWMGYDMLSHASAVALDTTASSSAAYSWPKLLFFGAAICAANPYFTGWWATIGAGQLAHMAPRTPGEYVAFYIGHEGADYSWYGLVGVVIVTGARWLTPPVYHSLILVCGSVILLLGIWFFFRGIMYMRGESHGAF